MLTVPQPCLALDLVWQVSYHDGPCARGVAAERRLQPNGTFAAETVFATFNTGPVLELDGETGNKLRVFAPRPQFNMALGLCIVCPGVLAVCEPQRASSFLSSSQASGAVGCGWMRRLCCFI